MQSLYLSLLFLSDQQQTANPISSSAAAILMREKTMHRFIYVRHASKGTSFEDFGDISAKSKINNLRDGLTGVLLWANGTFIQLIEGPKRELDLTIARIEMDIRHSGMMKLSYKKVTEIICVDWAMGCYPMPAAEFRSSFTDALDVTETIRKFGEAPDAELDAFFGHFYRNNIEQLQAS